jgi:hypothetical protein
MTAKIEFIPEGGILYEESTVFIRFSSTSELEGDLSETDIL